MGGTDDKLAYSTDLRNTLHNDGAADCSGTVQVKRATEKKTDGEPF
jgi:hypothetical protein